MIKELVDTYLKSRGLKRQKGRDDDATPLLPLIMMDSAYQLFNTYIKPVNSRFEMKKYKNEWLKAYNSFNKDFFSCYNEEQTDYLIDMMDAFAEYIKNHEEIVFVQFTNQFKNEPLERQKVLSASMIINVYCQCAEIIWEAIFRNAYHKENKNILACERLIHKWNAQYYGADKPDVDPNKNEEICRCVDILCRKQTEFIRNYVRN